MARYGLVELPPNGLRLVEDETAAGNYIAINAPTLSGNLTFVFPNALPGSTQVLTVDSSGNMGYANIGAGTVTSVAVSVPSSLLSITGSPVTTSGTIALDLQSQTANRVFAAPNGSDGTPTFRALVYADVSAIVGTSANTLAAGNDARFHTQGTDTGTTATSFLLDSDAATPIRLKNSAGELQARNNADDAYVDARFQDVVVEGDLTVLGDTVTLDISNLQVEDPTITLARNVTGTPTLDLGLIGERGTSTNAELLWVESADQWQAGVNGALLPIARRYTTTFVNAGLTSGSITITHNLGVQVVAVSVADSGGEQVHPDAITFDSVNALTLDMNGFGTLVGTYTVTVLG